MKLWPIVVGVVAILCGTFFVARLVSAAGPAFQVASGGTGSTTLTGILIGNGTSPIKSLTVGSGCTLIGTTLSCAGTATQGAFASSSAFTAGQIPYATNTNGTPINLSAVSTTSATISSGLTYSGTFGALVGGADGTLTCTTGSATVFGCLTAANFNIFSNKLGTSSALTAGNLIYATTNAQGNTVAGVATTTLSGSGLISVTAGAVVIGASPITVSCASCSSTTGTVTSVASTNGIQGGTITSSGTLSLVSYLATSSAETATRIPVWSSTSGTPATLGGGFSGYTLTSLLATLTNASTTNLTADTYLRTPIGGTSGAVPSNIATSSIVVNAYNQASSSVAIGDGTNTNNIFAVHSWGGTFASSTLTYYGAFGSAGTTTTNVANPIHSSTLLSAFCKTDVGTAYIVFGNGSASTTAFQCTTAGAQSTFTTNNTWKGRQPVLINLGDSASSPNLITVTADVIDSN